MLKLVASSALLALVLTQSAPARACDGPDDQQTAAHTPAKAAAPKALTVDDLAARMAAAEKAKTQLALFDVNSAETRAKNGVIPTAVLLTSSKTYDLALLPKDKASSVVFYCAGEKCGASKSAAKRAIEAGYTDVSVMPAGIAGWVKAGKAVAKPSLS